MDRTRRGFLTTAAALAAGSLAGGAEVRPWDGRRATTKADLDKVMNSLLKGGSFTCVHTPDTGDGPFYAESSLLRRDITEGRKGVPLRLGIRVINAIVGATGSIANANAGNSCAPLAGAVVDIWHADADGLYSNVAGDLQMADTSGKTFMRGHLVTDADGYVEFETVVPGWELVPMPPPIGVAVRTTHIHVKVFHEYQVTTTQLYLPDEFLDELYASIDPYHSHQKMAVPGVSELFDRIRNTEDNGFTSDPSAPLSIHRQGTGVFAQATIGIVSMGTRGPKSLFR